MEKLSSLAEMRYQSNFTIANLISMNRKRDRDNAGAAGMELQNDYFDSDDESLHDQSFTPLN
jgi:hypothetical protein